MVAFDVIVRYSRFAGYDVTYVRNITDVDDKINASAQGSGRSIGEITAETIGWYLDDMAALGNLEPDHMPRATQYIPQMVSMIQAFRSMLSNDWWLMMFIENYFFGGTGSSPDLPQGWQRKMRQVPSHDPR